MENIYTGNEKHLHRMLALDLIKSYRINKSDIGFIEFKIMMPKNDFPLWTLEIFIETDISTIYEKKYFIKNCVKHNFKCTLKNLYRL